MYYFITCFFILICAQANLIAINDITCYIFDLLVIIVGIEYKRFTEYDVKVIGGFGIIYISFMTIRFLVFNHIGVFFYLSDVYFLIKQVFISFLLCAFLKEKTAYYLTRTIYYSAAISLFFFTLQMINWNIVYSLGHSIGFPSRIQGYTDYTNFLIYTFDKGHASQNVGIAWEPGAYGFILNTGLLLYLLLNKFTFDKKVLIFVLAVITTFSTTNYIVLIVIFLLFYRVRGGKFNKFILFVMPVFAVLLFQAPFLISKIVMIYKDDKDELDHIYYLNGFYKKNGGQIPLNRFGSITYLYNMFTYKLIWGISNAYQGVNSTLNNINISNGDIDFIAKFGLIGFVFLMHRFALFVKAFLVKAEFVFYCILILILLAFGEPILISQLILVLLFLHAYIRPEEEPEESEENVENEGYMDSHYLINTPF